MVTLGQGRLILLFLVAELVLLILALFVPLAHLHDVNSFLFRLLDFLPRLFLLQLKKCDAVSEEFDVVLSPLFSGTLFSESIADLHGLPLDHLIAILRVVLLLQPVNVVLHHLLLLLLLLHVHSLQVLLLVLLLIVHLLLLLLLHHLLHKKYTTC